MSIIQKTVFIYFLSDMKNNPSYTILLELFPAIRYNLYSSKPFRIYCYKGFPLLSGLGISGSEMVFSK
ncbi:MAG: hypothetical protein KA461_11830 [Flavobacterium sp.]|nr:hypothetical protein [Flavobacterium sp.]